MYIVLAGSGLRQSASLAASITTAMEGYMVDCILLLSYPIEENARRKYMEVLKMRGTKHLTGEQSVDIDKSGFIVQPGLR